MNAVDLELRHVVKRFGSATAVDDLSLTVPAGKICVVVGPSGCGKTTTLRMINRLIEPTSGEILIGGRDVTSQDPVELRRGIGYVIQQVGLLPHLTVGDNVAIVPRLLGWEKERVRARVDELIGLVGLDVKRFRDRYPGQLSGGERQRVGVARALAADPPLMLMDEPFGAVDPIVRERLQNELLRLQDQIAKTIVFVTHDIDEAIKMGDLVAVLQVGGVLAQFGPPTDLLSNPASDFVARFVGADRGLKRLSLRTVGDLEILPVATARVGENGTAAGQRRREANFPYVLLVDEAGRSIGWLDERATRADDPLGQDAVSSESPLFGHRTTLRDALSQMLGASVLAGIVVDEEERVEGVVTLDQIAATLREEAAA